MDVSIESLLADFRWLSIDFGDAQAAGIPGYRLCSFGAMELHGRRLRAYGLFGIDNHICIFYNNYVNWKERKLS